MNLRRAYEVQKAVCYGRKDTGPGSRLWLGHNLCPTRQDPYTGGPQGRGGQRIMTEVLGLN